MISLRLPPATEKRLTTHAKKMGKTRSEIVKKSIEEFLERNESVKTAFDLGEDLLTDLPAGPKDLAENRKAYLHKKLAEKHAKRRSH